MTYIVYQTEPVSLGMLMLVLPMLDVSPGMESLFRGAGTSGLRNSSLSTLTSPATS